MGDLRPNFSSWEFDCKHCGDLKGPTGRLLDVLQRLRDARGSSLRIVSGYRCPTHNARVGGSPASQHLTGRAADLERAAVTPLQCRAAGVIGCGLRDGQVVHVDVRPKRDFFTFRD